MNFRNYFPMGKIYGPGAGGTQWTSGGRDGGAYRSKGEGALWLANGRRDQSGRDRRNCQTSGVLTEVQRWYGQQHISCGVKVS
jgi:hypothetical protein